MRHSSPLHIPRTAQHLAQALLVSEAPVAAAGHSATALAALEAAHVQLAIGVELPGRHYRAFALPAAPPSAPTPASPKAALAAAPATIAPAAVAPAAIAPALPPAPAPLAAPCRGRRPDAQVELLAGLLWVKCLLGLLRLVGAALRVLRTGRRLLAVAAACGRVGRQERGRGAWWGRELGNG